MSSGSSTGFMGFWRTAHNECGILEADVSSETF